jgi:hypothetical protein
MFLKYLAKMDLILILSKFSGQIGLKPNRLCSIQQFDRSGPVNGKRPYTQLAATLKHHYAPKKLVIAERYRFHNCVQREGESVSMFVANLKRLACTCNFGARLNRALRDRFVCGLRSANIKKKLMADDYTFNNALNVALGSLRNDEFKRRRRQKSNARMRGTF